MEQTKTRKTKCWDCLGSGYKKHYQKIDNGICYTCKGTGIWYERSAPLSHSEQKRREYLQNTRKQKRLGELHKEFEGNKKELLFAAQGGDIEKAGQYGRRNLEIKQEAEEIQKELTETIYIFNH